MQRQRTALALPVACPVCEAFDQRCVYCPSNSEKWLAEQNTGFVPSVGHISSNAVCEHHKYGEIPEGIDYKEKQGAAEESTVATIVTEPGESQCNLIIVAFQTDELAYCLQCHFAPEYISTERAATYWRALSFALRVAASLNAIRKRRSSVTLQLASFAYFETWEQVAARSNK
jgi:hypothetical protein